MIVSINGYFLNLPNTGSGQYALHLAQRLNRVNRAIASPQKPLGNLAKLWWEQWRWPRAARLASAQLMHSPYFALPLRRGLPSAVTIHDLIPMVLAAYQGSRLVRAYTWLQARACRTAEAIIVDSECSKRDVVRLLGVPEERVHVVYLGVDERFFAAAGGRGRGASPMEGRYVFYLGGWDVRKNVVSLIRAFEAVSRERPDLVLAIAGKPGSNNSAMFPDLRAAAAPLGDRVRFLGVVPESDKVSWYRHAELFVFPSLYEGFGLDPLEALACGCPVVCSNASSLPEVVGDAGLLVDASDPAALAEGMRRALADPEPLREKGPVRAATFTWDRTAAETTMIYEQVLGQRAN